MSGTIQWGGFLLGTKGLIDALLSHVSQSLVLGSWRATWG